MCVFKESDYSTMKNFAQVARLPDVLGATVSDLSGALLESSGAIDGEVAGAIHAYALQSMMQAGETLGLGACQRVTVTGPTKAFLIIACDNEVLGADVDPTKPLNVIEKKILDVLYR